MPAPTSTVTTNNAIINNSNGSINAATTNNGTTTAPSLPSWSDKQLLQRPGAMTASNYYQYQQYNPYTSSCSYLQNNNLTASTTPQYHQGATSYYATESGAATNNPTAHTANYQQAQQMYQYQQQQYYYQQQQQQSHQNNQAVPVVQHHQQHNQVGISSASTAGQPQRHQLQQNKSTNHHTLSSSSTSLYMNHINNRIVNNVGYTQGTNSNIVASSAKTNTTREDQTLMKQQVILSPLVTSKHSMIDDPRISNFSKILLRHIELLQIWDDNTQDKHIGYRLTGCTCPYKDQVSGKSLVGFVYRPTSVEKFCDFLPVFYLHLRDDKCPTARPQSLCQSLTDTFHSRNLGIDVIKSFCTQYFRELGIQDVPGYGLRLVNPEACRIAVQTSAKLNAPQQQQEEQSEVINVDDDEEVLCMNDAVASALQQRVKGQETRTVIQLPSSPPPPANLLQILSPFTLPAYRPPLIRPDTPDLIIKLLKSIEFYQPLPPNKLICRCVHSRDYESALHIQNIKSLPYDLHHYFLYHLLNNCGDIPGETVINLKRQRPPLFSKEYYVHRDYLITYMTKFVTALQLEDAKDGGIYCKSGGPGSVVQNLESVDMVIDSVMTIEDENKVDNGNGNVDIKDR